MLLECSPDRRELPCWPDTAKNQTLSLQFYISDNWKNFPQMVSGSMPFKLCFSSTTHTSGARCPRGTSLLGYDLRPLHLYAGESAQWIAEFLKAIPKPGLLVITKHGSDGKSHKCILLNLNQIYPSSASPWPDSQNTCSHSNGTQHKGSPREERLK